MDCFTPFAKTVDGDDVDCHAVARKDGEIMKTQESKDGHPNVRLCEELATWQSTSSVFTDART